MSSPSEATVPDPLSVTCPICDAQPQQQCRRYAFPKTRPVVKYEVRMKEPHWLRGEIAREEAA
ncbi:hypothetical protein NWT09_14150 [Mycolicibacterium sp. jd]|uniref:zinc finger domain-containing protein n=1 Tax=unclassified Mycolicibacterium TaxID=2636767 RepID=UPI00351B3449